MHFCRSHSPVFWITSVLLLLSSAVHANLIRNGSFEYGVDPGNLVLLPFGSMEINYWVVGGPIDYIGTLWDAAEGRRSVDLNGDGPGALGQTLLTIPGTLYEVQFAMAGNPDGGPSTKYLRVSAEAAGFPRRRSFAEFTFDTAGQSRQEMGYVARTFLFTATSPVTTLGFASLISGPYGPVIDNVTADESRLQNVNSLVNVVPEPQSYKTTTDTEGCPIGFVGKFFFTTTLAAKHGSPPLSDLVVQVAQLSNGNLLQNADGGPSGVGGLLTISKDLDPEYRDGILTYPENIRDIPFTICLQSMTPFMFFVDVFGSTTITVNSTGDAVDLHPGEGGCDRGDGVCTLRAAIQEANALPGPNTITVPAGTYTLSIPGVNENAAVTGDLDITDDLTIIGAGAENTIIDGGDLDRVIEVAAHVVITGVTIQNGTSDTEFGGGGIYNRRTLTLINSTVSGNSALLGNGGGILNFATLTLINSTVSGNSAPAAGGIASASSSTTMRLVNSTISGNSASFDGGGIELLGRGTGEIFNSTVSLNSAGRGVGGIFSGGDPANAIVLKNTIIANNSGGNCRGRITDNRHNLQFPANSCGDSIQVADPLLGPLQDNGGPTFTHALLPGSPAIDAVPIADCTFDDDGNPATREILLITDQRGMDRPLGATCDIGAYEFP